MKMMTDKERWEHLKAWLKQSRQDLAAIRERHYGDNDDARVASLTAENRLLSVSLEMERLEQK